MNTKLYRQVLSLTDSLMAAAQAKNQKQFDRFYRELKSLCELNDNTNKDHPVQWETLADFTDDFEHAAKLYEYALLKAESINENDYCASIGYSLATMLVELGDKARAVTVLKKAKNQSDKIMDEQLKNEIINLLNELTP